MNTTEKNLKLGTVAIMNDGTKQVVLIAGKYAFKNIYNELFYIEDIDFVLNDHLKNPTILDLPKPKVSEELASFINK